MDPDRPRNRALLVTLGQRPPLPPRRQDVLPCEEPGGRLAEDRADPVGEGRRCRYDGQRRRVVRGVRHEAGGGVAPSRWRPAQQLLARPPTPSWTSSMSGG